MVVDFISRPDIIYISFSFEWCLAKLFSQNIQTTYLGLLSVSDIMDLVETSYTSGKFKIWDLAMRANRSHCKDRSEKNWLPFFKKGFIRQEQTKLVKDQSLISPSSSSSSTPRMYKTLLQRTRTSPRLPVQLPSMYSSVFASQERQEKLNDFKSC